MNLFATINRGFIRALVRRDLWKYFTNPTGYVFITLFVFLSAAGAFWQDRFFQANLANLDQLNAVFPYLLVLFIPALTMSVWSEEKKQATDELLLTLPATSLDVVVGKYLAVLGIYSVALLLSFSHVLVLMWLGAPDLGLMLGNYLGYWLIGAAMIGVGMLASLLTSNVTVAFIAGAAFSAILAFGPLAVSFSETLSRWIAPVSAGGHFEDFSRGVVSLSGLLYFISLGALALYLNVLRLDSRHWPHRTDGMPMWGHHTFRAVAVIVAVIAVNVVIGRGSVRLDVTAERLHSLSSETRELIAQISEDRPVFVQVYVSGEVPEQYVQVRENLLGVLREIDSIAGPRVQVLIEETEPFTEEARDAREKFGITPRQIPVLASARTSVVDVFLGVAVTSGAREQVIPFLDRGLSPEYELTRSIRVVAATQRKRVGVVDNDLRLLGGIDFQTMQNSPEWSVVTELRKQYEVVTVTPDGPISEELDALLVILPSSLAQEEMDQVQAYIETGNPAMLLVDPLPVVNVGMAPLEQGGNTNPSFGNNQPPPEPKGDIGSFMASLGVGWNPGEIVWDTYNPHPDLAHLAPEIVFVGQGNQNAQAFNPEHMSSSELQELVMLYPGHINPVLNPALEFTSLVRSGFQSGPLSYFQIVQRTLFGMQLNPNLPHQPDARDFILAAHVRGTGPQTSGETPEAAPGDASPENVDGEAPEQTPAEPSTATSAINVIVVADIDFISEQFFLVRAQAPADMNFDNVSFFLNAMDLLTDDTAFISLRSKRARHRTLERVEAQVQGFIEARIEGEEQAEQDAQVALDEAQQRLNERVAAVQQRTDLDAQTKQIMARNLQEAENRRFEVLRTNIETEKEARINASEEDMEAQIRSIQNNIKTFAVLLPPLPVFAVGVMIFLRRREKEREGAQAARRFRSES
jgi:ABC-2 type transport system permease protein